MKTAAVVIISAITAATCFAPAAYARHKHAKHMMAPMPMAEPAPMNPRVDANGDFYATPIAATAPMAGPGEGLPGLGLAGSIVNGVTQPVLAPLK